MEQSEIISLIQGELWERIEKIAIVRRYNAPLPVHGKASVLIGMRRVGKTYSLFSYLQDLDKSGVDRRSILFLNLEDDRLQIHDAAALSSMVDQFFSATPANYKRKTFIFLDEIQAVTGWEQVARRLVETDRCELWLTGSSAKMLSKEVATQFRGRSLTHEIWPFDYFEYLQAANIAWIDPSKSFANRDLAREQLEAYLLQGGFPEVINKSADIQRRILDDYRSVVLLRDIVERHGVSNLYALEQLVASAIINSGRLLSVNKLTADLRSRGIALGKDTLFDYLTYLEDAFLAFLAPLYDESLRARSTTPKKIFCIDTGMVSNYSLRPRADMGRLFENLIFLDLKRQGYQIYYYVTKEGFEVDFAVLNPQRERFIVQACFDILNETTRAREEASLKSACKELKCGGVLVTPQLYCQNRHWIPSLT